MISFTIRQTATGLIVSFQVHLWSIRSARVGSGRFIRLVILFTISAFWYGLLGLVSAAGCDGEFVIMFTISAVHLSLYAVAVDVI